MKKRVGVVCVVVSLLAVALGAAAPPHDATAPAQSTVMSFELTVLKRACTLG